MASIYWNQNVRLLNSLREIKLGWQQRRITCWSQSCLLIRNADYKGGTISSISRLEKPENQNSTLKFNSLEEVFVHEALLTIQEKTLKYWFSPLDTSGIIVEYFLHLESHSRQFLLTPPKRSLSTHAPRRLQQVYCTQLLLLFVLSFWKSQFNRCAKQKIKLGLTSAAVQLLPPLEPPPLHNLLRCASPVF